MIPREPLSPPTVAGQIDFTLILPLFNEGDVLADNLKSICETLDRASFSFELVLIDDCSNDDSFTTAEKLMTGLAPTWRLFRHEQNRGRGATVVEGIKLARGKIAGFIDVDCEVSPEYLVDFVQDILAGRHDVVTGFRIYPITAASLMRTITSFGYRVLERILIGQKYEDSQTGYKIFRREKVLPLLSWTPDPGWFWDTQIMAVCAFAGLRIAERPVQFSRNPKKRSTVKLFRDSFEMFFKLLWYAMRVRGLRRVLRNSVKGVVDKAVVEDFST